MTQVHCPCGHRFSDIVDPNPNKAYLISDEQSEKLAEQIIETSKQNDEQAVSDHIHFLVIATGNIMYVCPICKRLLIIDKDNHLVNSYIQE